MSALPISSAMRRGSSTASRTRSRAPPAGSALRRPAGRPDPVGGDDRREVVDQPCGHGGVRVESHRRAIRARSEGRFNREITPIAGIDHDEGPREPNWDKIRSLPPVREGGRVTAAVSSQISDGAAALLVASAEAVEGTASRPGPGSTTCRPAAPTRCGCSPPPIPATALRAGQGRAHARRHRPGRDQRGLRLRRPGLAEGDRRRPRPRSTSTAAPSRSATRWAPPAPG